MIYRGIEFVFDNNGSFTAGLKKITGYEFFVPHSGNREGEIFLIEYLVDYVLDYSPKISPDQTITFGVWLLKFVEDEGHLVLYELDDNFEQFQKGVENSVYYYQLQKANCNEYAVEMNLPKFTQLIAVSDGVLEGMCVQGIRYKEPDHMTGWYLTTKLYDGKISNMKIIPLQQLVVKRKDLIEFLALPERFVFETFDDHSCQIRQLSEFGNDLNSN